MGIDVLKDLVKIKEVMNEEIRRDTKRYEELSIKKYGPGGIRTLDLRLRRPTPYPS